MTPTRISLSDPVVVATSPGPESRWGYYQFPDMWRAAGGEIYLCVNVGPDSELGEHEPSLWFLSSDDGGTWMRTGIDNVDLSPDVHTLPHGGQVRFGQERWVHHWSTYGPHSKWPRIRPRRLGVEPVLGPWYRPYALAEQVAYRLGDVPEEHRRFAMAVRESAQAPWQPTTGIVDAPDLLMHSLVRTRRWFEEKGEEIWQDVKPSFKTPIPVRVAVLPDGALLAAMHGQNPAVADRCYCTVLCVASEDGGRAWRPRGAVAGDTHLTTHGYGGGEQEIVLMPDGDLLCVMRTEMDAAPESSRCLMTARSCDGGHTWGEPAQIAGFSVTPHLMALECGAAAVVYGRPGVYARTSSDAGRTWGEPVSLIGPPEDEFTSRPAAEWWPDTCAALSCGNTDVVVTGPDRFLVAYSDFQHPRPGKEQRKAVLEREVVVG